MIKKIIITVAAFLILGNQAFASVPGTPITVPSAAGYGSMLVSTSTGAYIATTTDPLHAGSYFATSTATSTFKGPLYAPCFSTNNTSCITGGGGGTPGGSDTQIQFNDGGSFGGNSAAIFQKTTGLTTLQNLLLTASTTLQNFTGVNATTTNATTTNMAISNLLTLAGRSSAPGNPPSGSIYCYNNSSLFVPSCRESGGGTYVMVSPLSGGTSQWLHAIAGDGTLSFSQPAFSDISGTCLVSQGCTGQTSFSQGWLGIDDTGAFVSSTSPTVNYITATSTTHSSFLANASTTNLSVSGLASTTNLTVSSIKNALVLTNTNGAASGYAGTSCTNQFPRSLSALGAATCATVNLTSDVTGTLPIGNGGTNNASAYTQGSVIFSNGTSLTQDNSKFFWDDTNFRLGIGSSTPFASLSINPTAGFPPANTPAFVIGSSTATVFSITPYSSTPGLVLSTSTAALDGSLLLASSSGQVAIGTTTPTANFTVVNPSGNATTTVEFGRGGNTKGTCVKMYDDVGTAYYLHIAGASLIVSTNNCASVTGF